MAGTFWDSGGSPTPHFTWLVTAWQLGAEKCVLTTECLGRQGSQNRGICPGHQIRILEVWVTL